jgi:hypothetical protein
MFINYQDERTQDECVIKANGPETLISLRLGFRRNFNEEQTENFFGILISTRLPKPVIK